MNAIQKTVDVSVAQMSVQELLTLLNEGADVLLTNGNNPIARLVPIVQENPPRIAGLHLGAISTSDDFDEPLTDEFWAI